MNHFSIVGGLKCGYQSISLLVGLEIWDAMLVVFNFPASLYLLVVKALFLYRE